MPLQRQLTIEADFLKRNPSKKLVVGVAIDGSTLSDKALQTACGLVQQERGDRLVILHVADSSKKYLPRHLQSKHLETLYTSKAFDFKVTRAEWACLEKGPDDSTCEVLMRLAHEQNIDLLVVGSFGRKGEKLDVLGTVSDYSLREGHSSVAIVRSTAKQPPPGQHLYMFATDGSRAAASAFCILCHQLMRPGDRLLLVSCSYEHQTQEGEALKDYTMLAASLKLPCEVLMWHLGRDKTVADGLLEIASMKDVDTLVCGISGYSHKKLGSVSDELTQHATCNTIVIKDTYEVLANQFAKSGIKGLTEVITPAKELSRVSRGSQRNSMEIMFKKQLSTPRGSERNSMELSHLNNNTKSHT